MESDFLGKRWEPEISSARHINYLVPLALNSARGNQSAGLGHGSPDSQFIQLPLHIRPSARSVGRIDMGGSVCLRGTTLEGDEDAHRTAA